LSVSSSRVEVDGRDVHVSMRCEARTLDEVLHVDRNGDGAIDADELAAARGEIETYLLDRFALSTGAAHDKLDGRLERLRAIAIGDEMRVLDPMHASGAAHASEPARASAPTVEPARASTPMVDIGLEFTHSSALADLSIDCALFRESDPWHRHQTEIVWNGGERESHLLWVEDSKWTLAGAGITHASTFVDESGLGKPAVERSVAQHLGFAYVRLGIEHILTGYDHVAFLIALIVASRRVRSLFAVVTAFTCAHSLSLACAATGLVSVSPRVVEPLIALSIAYVGCRNVLDRADRRVWIEAFAFGLVHGLGFAGSIAETLAAETEKLRALFAFNLGVELGQLAIVIALVAVLRALSSATVRRGGKQLARDASMSLSMTRPERLAPAWIRVTASLAVALLGACWFVARAWGV
jgi:hydrogenase/urease accessory protein HupE